MPRPHDIAPPSGRPDLVPLDLNQPRLRRYLPPVLADELIREGDSDTAPTRLVEAAVHLACARSVIGTYLPRMLASQLLDERLESPWLGWMEGSLLFADLSGSTALAERLGTLGREGTEMVTGFLNQIFTTLIQIIQDYGGDLVTFGGDALLVFFGDDRHPRTAARAALALRDVMRDYIQIVPGLGSFPMHLHIGVESGRVAFVSAGGDAERYYSVLGATVNRVAEAEAYAQPNEVVAGPGAWATLAQFAAGEAAGTGFYRLVSMRAPARPHQPLPDEPVLAEAPEQAIPLLLDELDRISPYIPRALLGRILAEPQLPQIEAELRPVSVLFAQVVGLEVLAEALPPPQAALAVQAYVGAMQAALERFGGAINKLDVVDEGVKLVAIFGAPVAYEDHAERATRAALAMQEQLEAVNAEIKGQGSGVRDPRLATDPWPLAPDPQPLRQRIGVNLGTAFAGNVGSAARKEYTVMGDAVNVAARVMSSAAWGEVWCSEATVRAIGSRMACDDRGYLALKGKALPLQLFRLIGPRDMPALALTGDEAPLFGRDAEMAWLRRHLDAAVDGAGRTLRVTGEAGIGKSRVTAELIEQAAARGAWVIQAACFSYTASIPYAAWGEWLKSLSGIASGDDDAMRERKLAARLAELGPGMAEWLPLLGDLARLDVPENRLTRGLDPQMRQNRRFELLEGLLMRAARDQPVVALFEDLHWADPISLDLWQRVARAVEGQPILLLGAHRPADLFDGGDDGAQVLALKELSRDQSAGLAAALAGDQGLPAPLVQKLVERAAGNPLFLAELLRAVIQRSENADWEAGSAPSRLIPNSQPSIPNLLDDLPDSLNGLLLARIDRLGEGSRSVLRVASVIGHRIPFDVLHSIQRVEQQALLRELVQLDSENMTMLERAEPERIHIFRHALIQEVAYQNILYARRRELHGRIGQYLERRYAGDLDDYYGLLAHHYRHSDRHDKAVEYLLKAGHAAQAVYANDEALHYYTWALDALAGDDTGTSAWDVRDALGDVLAELGRYDEALAQHTAILEAPGVAADAARRAYCKRGNVLAKQGHFAAALAELDRAMTIARSGVAGIAPLAIPLIDADFAFAYRQRGEYDLAIAACEEGLRVIQDDPSSFEDEKIEARLHSELGGCYGARGDFPQAREHIERSLELRNAVDDLPGMIDSHINVGYLWQLEEEYERAIEHYRVAEELAKKLNLIYKLAYTSGNAASALTSLGAYAEAEARGLETLTLVRRINVQLVIGQTHKTLGIISYHTGDYDRALAAFAEALRLARALGSGSEEAHARMHIAMTLSVQGRFAEAQAEARLALERAETLHVQLLTAESLNALAEAELGLGDLDAAARHAGAAVVLGDEIGSRRETGIARRLLGDVASSRGEPFEPAFEASIALLAAIKDPFELARTWVSYGTSLLRHGNETAGDAYLKQARAAFISIGAHGELQRHTMIAERSI
jgi:class 3 adenylate cyclase/tetratricopeptide (TPR) repeat protein